MIHIELVIKSFFIAYQVNKLPPNPTISSQHGLGSGLHTPTLRILFIGTGKLFQYGFG